MIQPDFADGKTLFLPAPGRDAVLVTTQRTRRHSKPMRFKGPHAALNWCIQNGAGLVYMPVADAVRN